jgi:hypothetical protein
MDNTRLSKRTFKYINFEEEQEEIVDDLRRDGNASMKEQGKRPNP